MKKTLTVTPECLGEAVETTTEIGIKVAGAAADALTPYLPLIGLATTFIGEIINIYQQAEYNKNIVSALYDRAKSAELAVDTLQRRKKLREKDLKNQEWYNAFNRFVDNLEEIKTFVKEVSSLHGYKKYLKSSLVKEKFDQLTNDYDNIMKDLHFTMVVSNEEQRLYDNECLMEDIAEMSKVSYIDIFFF